VCPDRGVGVAVVIPEVNIEAMNEHLAVISRAVSPGTIGVVVLDGAGWHDSSHVKVPANIVLLPLPPYAPELNGAENNSYDAIVDACCEAWNWLMDLPDVLSTVVGRDYITVRI
jgi:hypothetical protein